MIQREIILLFIFAFLPAIIYVIWIRNTEKYNRERWIPIFICFIWGASIAIIASIFLELFLEISLTASIQSTNLFGLSTAIIIAPFVEELVKPFALRTRIVKREIKELEDGLIYGAVAGLGFSATENLFYGYSFLSEGLVVFLILIIVRSFGGCLLHASATALTGYGYGKTLINGTSKFRIVPYFIIAVFAHALYNFLVSYNIFGAATGLLLALLLVYVSIKLVRNKIRNLDLSNR
ncbi:MAG: PrsW family intramembrane metalloprotease [Candidatus Thermoplasmatota archaeon]|nr:PrsW family intramembrane metalloprotease [Candidatus Thermoplasmatota archaeon]MCK5300894.1 PrsW family intramembrane metalloprotease [Thermoplasmatales archaeon]